tara:strand:+ start:1086 stop:1316 length:231 start_codon:yes stop_codon:yes gene_type:complete
MFATVSETAEEFFRRARIPERRNINPRAEEDDLCIPELQDLIPIPRFPNKREKSKKNDYRYEEWNEISGIKRDFGD